MATRREKLEARREVWRERRANPGALEGASNLIWHESLNLWCRTMPPTKRHRPAVQETILGALEAWNEAGERKYFDYDYEGALAYAGYSTDRDPRWDNKLGFSWATKGPKRIGKKMLWLLKE